jgi:hypothetical protein
MLEYVSTPSVNIGFFPQIRSLLQGFRASLSFVFLPQKAVEQLRELFTTTFPIREFPVNGCANGYLFDAHLVADVLTRKGSSP